MGSVLLIARVVLAAVFAVAGAAKLADRDGARRAAAEFGVPGSLAGVVAVVLPLVELGLAGALLPASSAAWAGVGALALLAVFAAAIAVSMARGRAPDCHCFGQLHSEPAGWRTLGRNVGLAGLAGLVAFAGFGDPGPSAVAWLADLDGTERAAVAAAALALATAAGAAWFGVHLLRAHGRLLLRLDQLEARLELGPDHAHEHHAEEELGLPVGTEAPAFSLPLVAGGETSLSDLVDGRRPLVLVFADPDCGPCATLMPEVARWQRERADELRVAVVSGGRPRDTRAEAEEHGLELVLIDEKREVYELFGGAGTPTAVLVAADGTIGSPLAAGSAAIQKLADRARGYTGDEWGIPLGEPLPDVTLTDLDGRVTELSAFRGNDTLFLFWNPADEFCAEIKEELLAWEEDAAPGTPGLVVLAVGDREAIRREGFRSPVLLDERFEATIALRSAGTPSGVLVDTDGRIAWPLAAGGEHVLRLLRSRTSAGIAS